MQKTISLGSALAESIIEDCENPVISYYELVLNIYKFYKTKEYKEIKIGKITSQSPSEEVISRNINKIIHDRVISGIYKDICFRINSKKRPTPQQILCSINPFCYLSYLSAKEWHGLTDKIPYTIYATAISRSNFYKALEDYIERYKLDYNPEAKSLIPSRLMDLYHISDIDGKEIKIHSKSNLKIPTALTGTGGIRVSSIGDTFLEMTRKPDYCGGIDHVISCFKNHAENNLPKIINSLNKNGTNIDKSRVGYILEEKCNLTHRHIDKWSNDVQRGGSRKLVYNNDFSSIYSERWCISINN